MATQLNQGAASTLSNIVRLPTAAARKVDNRRFASQRRAAIAASDSGPFADRYQTPRHREAVKLASDLMKIKQTPALILVSAILATMDAEAYTKVVGQFASGVASGRPAITQAFAALKASRLTSAQQMDLFRVFDRLNGEGC